MLLLATPGKVGFTSSDSKASLPATYTFTTGTGKDNGIHTFTSGATLNQAGTQSITATDTVTAPQSPDPRTTSR